MLAGPKKNVRSGHDKADIIKEGVPYRLRGPCVYIVGPTQSLANDRGYLLLNSLQLLIDQGYCWCQKPNQLYSSSVMTRDRFMEAETCL
jgi:hypothetical protein